MKYKHVYKDKQKEYDIIKKYFKIVEEQRNFIIFESSVKEVRKIKIDSLDEEFSLEEKQILHEILSKAREHTPSELSYAEYIAENLDNTIAYSEYIAENLDKAIDYSSYLAEKLDSIPYSEYVAEEKDLKIVYTNPWEKEDYLDITKVNIYGKKTES